MGRYIWKYIYTLAFITVSCYLCVAYPTITTLIIAILILGASVLARLADLGNATENSHRIMNYLLIYMRLSAILWWIYTILLIWT